MDSLDMAALLYAAIILSSLLIFMWSVVSIYRQVSKLKTKRKLYEQRRR